MLQCRISDWRNEEEGFSDDEVAHGRGQEEDKGSWQTVRGLEFLVRQIGCWGPRGFLCLSIRSFEHSPSSSPLSVSSGFLSLSVSIFTSPSNSSRLFR